MTAEADILRGQTTAFGAGRGRWTVLWTQLMPLTTSGYRNALMAVDIEAAQPGVRA